MRQAPEGRDRCAESRALGVVMLVAAGFFGCARAHRPARDPLAPVVIPFSPEEIPDGLTLDQRVVVTSPFGSSTFDVVVESHGNEVVVAGFTTYGVRAFVVVHDALGLHVEAAPLPELRAIPFDRVVRDIYAAFLLAPRAVPRSHALEVEERWQEDALLGREVIFDPGTLGAERVIVDYGPSGWRLGGAPPARVEVVHVASALRVLITMAAPTSTPAASPNPTP